MKCIPCNKEVFALAKIVDLDCIGASVTSSGVELDGYAKEEMVWWCSCCPMETEVKIEEVEEWLTRKKTQPPYPGGA